MQTNKKVSDGDLADFMSAARAKTNLDLEFDVGQRYAGQHYVRIFVNNYDNKGGRTVFCFIDLTNGDVLRPAGWKRPNLKLKNPIQGSVYDEHNGSGWMRAAG
jgi:hypothetical protein